MRKDASWRNAASRFAAPARRTTPPQRGRARVKTQRVFGAIEALRDGDNLLGIQERDLPLYFQSSEAMTAEGKFAAVSNFLAGTGPGDSAWTPAAIETAQTSLNAAEEAFYREYTRVVEQARFEGNYDWYVDRARTNFNRQLRDYCGSSPDSLVDDPNFSAARCAVSTGTLTCTVEPGEYRDWYLNEWTGEDYMGRGCVHGFAVFYDTLSAFDAALQFEDSFFLGNRSGFQSQAAREFFNTCPDAGADTNAVEIAACTDDASLACLRCRTDSNVAPLKLGPNTLEVGWSIPLADDPRARRNIANLCRALAPTMRLSVPDAPQGPLEQPICLKGSIGEAYLDLVDAAADLDAAESELREHTEAYDIAIKSCLILEEATDEVQRLREDHIENMEGLREARYQATRSAKIAEGTKECLSAAQDAAGDAVLSFGASAAISAGTCAAAATEAGFEVKAENIERKLEDAQQNHDDAVAKVEENAEVERCYNDARHELVGSRTAQMDIDSAVFALERAANKIPKFIGQAQNTWRDGHNYLKEAEGRQFPSPAGDLWLDEKVLDYDRDLRIARRATYLAIRAVEYEFQQSLMSRADALTAKTPTELEDALQEIWRTTGTRSILGSRPTELNTVLSLRDDILRLGDESTRPEAERPMTSAERFRTLIASGRYAVYGEDGDYEGQRIPFTLAPLGALGFDPGTVQLYAENDCAERLWSVNASVVGEDELFRGSNMSFVRMDLLKRNSFFSQWCGDPSSDAENFQQASVRPHRNLFRAPGFGESVGSELGTEQGIQAYSRARIQAFFGVDQAALEDPQYANGETGELAARGLYGEYALFIPAELISRGEDDDGLVFDHIDDILLRLDYVSVAAP